MDPNAVEQALPWLDELPADDRDLAIEELAAGLASVSDVASFRSFQSDLASWRCTAEIWSIPGLAERVLADNGQT